MSAIEVALGLAWITSTLTGDSTMVSLAPGGFHRGMAPPDTPDPFIVFGYQSGSDVTTANEYRLMCNILYQIRAVGLAANTDAIIAAAQQIDALFGGPTSGTTPGGLILSCARDGQIAQDELQPSGILLSNFGGLYRLEIQRTS